MSAHATPAHATPEAAHVEPAATPVAAETSSTPAHKTPEAAHATDKAVGETQAETATAAKAAAEPPHGGEHPKEDHPEGDHPKEDHDKGKEKAAAPHAAHPAAHPGHKLLIPKLEGDGLKKVSWDAAKGIWTIGTLPISVPYVAGRLVVGSLYAVGGKIYDSAAWVGHKAKSYWEHDKFYIPTAAKAVGGAIAWPFKKAWQSMKWTGRKIKGLITKSPEPEVTLPTHESTPAPAEAAPAAHGHPPEPAHATPAPAAPAAHATPAPAPAATPAPAPAPAAAAHPAPAHH